MISENSNGSQSSNGHSSLVIRLNLARYHNLWRNVRQREDSLREDSCKIDGDERRGFAAVDIAQFGNFDASE